MQKFVNLLRTTGILLLFAINISFFLTVFISKLGNSTIKAKIDGLGTKLLFITSSTIDRNQSQTKFAFSFNGRINVDLSIEETSSVIVGPVFDKISGKAFRSNYIRFHLDPDSTIIIKGKYDNQAISYDIVKGNQLSMQENELRKILFPYYQEESRLYHQARLSLKKNPAQSKRLTARFDSLRFYTVAPLRTKWAKEHLNYELAPNFLIESHVPKDTTIKYFNLLPPAVKEAPYGQLTEQVIAGWKRATSGKIAPSFAQYTYLNESFSLEGLRGRYIVLDFWGSWCGPCIAGFPRMKSYYEKYREAIEFVGIACNDQKDSWKKAIADHNLSWVQLLNEPTKNDVAELYGVINYPTKFIIDREGRILGKFSGENDDFYKKIDELLSE